MRDDAVRFGNPHDELFHTVFSRVDNAAGELCHVLPARIREQIDWRTLRLEDGHFVGLDSTPRQVDLLFSAKLKRESKALYLLLEHQSTADAMMPYRLHGYVVRIWDRWVVDHPGAKRLPVVLPVVVSHAVGGWSKAVSARELLDVQPRMLEAVAPYVPDFSFVLDDLATCSDEELTGRAMPPLAMLALLLLRHARDRSGFVKRLRQWAPLLKTVWATRHRRKAISILVRYAALANRQVKIHTLDGTLKSILGKGVSKVVMTEVRQLMIESETRGKAEGEAEGEARGRASSLLAVLAARGLRVSDKQRAQIIGCTDIAQLDRWIVGAATARTTAEALSED